MSTVTQSRASVPTVQRPVDGAAPPIPFHADPNAAFEQHLVLDHVVDAADASPRQRFEAAALTVRDLLAERWVRTNAWYDAVNPKMVYYLSMEYLIGRSLVNNVVNLGCEPLAREVLDRHGMDWGELAEIEPDAGLGNGGLGRLAACYVDSMATLALPAIGYGLRYQYGMFRQRIEDGWQVEQADNWLRNPDPWEVARPDEYADARLNASVQPAHGGGVEVFHNRPSTILGIPYDRPVIGYGGRTVNTLRLWGSAAPDGFDLREFSSGDFVGAVQDEVTAESLTKVLYPDDSTAVGRGLRFVQEYFLVACSLHDVVTRFRRRGNDWDALPDKVAIQLNDTHPSLAVAELMRLLMDRDDAGLGWDQAWDLTRRTLAFTNHTLLPEALEKWPVRMFETLIPRHLEIVYEVNRRLLDDVRARWPWDADRVRRMSLVEEGPERKVRMAHLAVVGSHRVNGVAAIHSRLLRERVMRDFADAFPDRFDNKTNGVTPRRWLLLANPGLSQLITGAIGDGWITDLRELRRLEPLADDPGFRAAFVRARRDAKVRLANWIGATLAVTVDPDTIFDCHVKRIHEYKRQLLNVIHIVLLYDRLRRDPGLDLPPRTFFFAGKAAPAYALAKRVIKLINNVAAVIDVDPAVRGRLKVVFLPDYGVSLAERIVPAADVSEQISTAGYEASGTSNMKFMMNGALTVGTRDGATIEIAEAAGEENLLLFGLTAEQVEQSRAHYNPWWHYTNEPDTRAAVDLIFGNHFSVDEPGIFEPIRDVLLTHGDRYMHLADLRAYAAAQQRVGELYADRDAWARKAILNVARSGRFSSDRAITEYATDIWHAEPCLVGEKDL